ncbi:hypothetical protein [Emticicia sp. BO119]|uniref:hypothetical protein n=1 Tax=Emticicia sp. BO119 TaxID=2757768 RepID=UPI0015F0E295|nr:hypothetical protein [Emticicia sp. BO119]MBA4849032.1 hypothetical protein [Emticicia sp. BO119]
MEKKEMPLWKKLLLAILYTAFVGIAAYLKGQNSGKEICEKAHKLDIQTQQEILQKHEKTLKTIRTESRNDAIERFHKDNGPDSPE